MNRRCYPLPLLIAASLSLVPLATGCSPTPATGQANAAQVTAAVPERVAVVRPTRKSLKLSTVQPGRIEPFEQTPLHAKLPGYVEQVLVDIGDAVAKDQTLIKLAIPELHDELEQQLALVAQAEAEVKQSESAVEVARAHVKTAEAKVAQSTASVARAAADQQRWQAELRRIVQLAETRAVTEKLVDETRSQADAAEAAYRESVAGLQATEAQAASALVSVQQATADLGASSARLRVAQANQRRTATMIEYTALKAPYAGLVTRRQVDTGHYVAPPGTAAPPLLIVCRTDTVRILVDIPELEAAWVQGGEQGDPVEVRIQALEPHVFTGRVSRTSWALDPTNHALRVEVDLPNPDGTLRPGMFATVAMQLEERPDCLAIPLSAVLREGTQTYCFVVNDGRLERRDLKLGLRSGGEVEAIAGIEPDSRLVVTPKGSLQAGQVVEPFEPTAK